MVVYVLVLCWLICQRSLRLMNQGPANPPKLEPNLVWTSGNSNMLEKVLQGLVFKKNFHYLPWMTWTFIVDWFFWVFTFTLGLVNLTPIDTTLTEPVWWSGQWERLRSHSTAWLCAVPARHCVAGTEACGTAPASNSTDSVLLYAPPRSRHCPALPLCEPNKPPVQLKMLRKKIWLLPT